MNDILATRSIYNGQVVHLKEVDVRIENDTISTREIVEHVDVAVILGITSDDEILLVEQFRHPIRETILEVPAGRFDESENPLHAAKREFREETGYEAARWTPIADVYSAPGFCDEKLYLFLAQDLTFHAQQLDEDEFITCRTVPVSECDTLIKSGKIQDAKTLLCLYHARHLFG